MEVSFITDKLNQFLSSANKHGPYKYMYKHIAAETSILRVV